jgi:hypothetical protein
VGIDYAPERHLCFIEKDISSHLREYDCPPSSDGSPTTFYENNPAFAWLDSRTPFTMLRKYKPARMIEVAKYDSPGRVIYPPSEVTAEQLSALPYAQVLPGDDVFHYAHRVLQSIIGTPAPNFPSRLKAMYSDQPVRVLSLRAGEAGIESSILKTAVPTEITLFDINEQLLSRAADALAPFARVYGVVGNVNQIVASRFWRAF